MAEIKSQRTQIVSEHKNLTSSEPPKSVEMQDFQLPYLNGKLFSLNLRENLLFQRVWARYFFLENGTLKVEVSSSVCQKDAKKSREIPNLGHLWGDASISETLQTALFLSTGARRFPRSTEPFHGCPRWAPVERDTRGKVGKGCASSASSGTRGKENIRTPRAAPPPFHGCPSK